MFKCWKPFVISLMIASTAGCGASISLGATGGNQTSDSTQTVKLGEVPIIPDISIYTPAMSSTVGIGLTGSYTLGRPVDSVKFHWKTSYGYFVIWQAPDFKVKQLGADIVYGADKIYWSFSPDDINTTKTDVKIELIVEDSKTGQILSTSTLSIAWENPLTAKVKK